MTQTPTTDQAPLPDFVGLDRLEALTREYAEFSGSSFGLGYVPLGLAFLIGVALAIAGVSPWAKLLVMLAPLLWLAGNKLARHHLYQRQGAVLELSDPRDKRSLRFRGRVWVVSVTRTLVVAFLVLGLANQLKLWFRLTGSRIETVLHWVGIIILVSLIPLTLRFVRSQMEGAILFMAIMPFLPGMSEWQEGLLFWGAFLLVPSVAFLGLGIYEHLKYRRLERQLLDARTGT